MSKNQINLPYNTRILLDGLGGGGISSELVMEFTDMDTPGASYAKVAADAIESLLLALACAGVDMGNPRIEEAMKAAVDAIGQNLGDDPANTIAVIVQGGVVQNVVSCTPMNYIVVDHDIEGADADEMFSFITVDGATQKALGHRCSADCNPEEVERIAVGLEA